MVQLCKPPNMHIGLLVGTNTRSTDPFKNCYYRSGNLSAIILSYSNVFFEIRLNNVDAAGTEGNGNVIPYSNKSHFELYDHINIQVFTISLEMHRPIAFGNLQYVIFILLI